MTRPNRQSKQLRLNWQELSFFFLIFSLLLITPIKAEEADATKTTDSVVVKTTESESAEVSRSFSANAIDDIKKRNELRIGMCKPDKPPFYFVNSYGRLMGSDVDLAIGIALSLGVDPVFIRTAPTHNDLVDQVSNNEVHIGISSISLTLPRAQKVYFTQPYLVVRPSFIFNWKVLASIAREPSLESLNRPEFRVVAPAGTSHVQNIQRLLPKATRLEMKDRYEWGPALTEGKVAAVFRDESEYYTLLEWYPEAEQQLSLWTVPSMRDPLAIAVPRGAEDLLQYINTYLALRERPESLAEIFEFYPNSTIDPGNPLPQK